MSNIFLSLLNTLTPLAEKGIFAMISFIASNKLLACSEQVLCRTTWRTLLSVLLYRLKFLISPGEADRWCQSSMDSCRLSPRRPPPSPFAPQWPAHTRSPALRPEHTQWLVKGSPVVQTHMLRLSVCVVVPDIGADFGPVRWSSSPPWQEEAMNPGPSPHRDTPRSPS